jgi:hypothetical protein
LATIGLVFVSFLVVSAWGMTLVGTQVLKAPRTQPRAAPSVVLFCTGDTLSNYTDPLPLPAGSNGTVVYGCGFQTIAGNETGLLPALQIASSGVVNASYSVPSGVSIYLVPNTGAIPGPMSQSQCTSTGILLTSNVNATIPVGSYSYCESFQDSSSLTDISVNWYEA